MKRLTFLVATLFLAVAASVAQAATVSGGTIDLPKTGQTVVYSTGDDGSLQAGVVWPSSRFTDNANGTVADNLQAWFG